MDTEERALWKSDAERYAGESYSAWPNRVLALLDEVDRLTEALEAAERGALAEAERMRWHNQLQAATDETERAEADLADVRATISTLGDAYREAIGVPEVEHVTRRLEAMALAVERAQTDLADEKRRHARLRAGVKALAGDISGYGRLDWPAHLTALLSDTPTGDLTEQGRALASQRDNLIARGVNPAELAIPIAPDATGDEI